ncbi:tryptophan halogenase family protein [Marinimicrobium sp. ABcell2]|uniref:tryptophan halogenase family protein n=1 Tax=Marinimicrobium sp. ABcell2 TaxID=3069751 RepID=UPI0027B3044C|nr:tryptophan halogenase family protein [Marinimicrobium sp. ABcell2]MDQ2077161.1 tryptophan 7-halogenase [Marinimicrobium sp. ABcell2]
MSNNPVESVVIVGGGTAGWMVAASLSNLFGKRLKITLVESSEIGTVGVGEATNATIRRFYGRLGMTDFDVLRATQGTCKLGIRFDNWHQKGHSYFHPFGVYGQEVRQVQFHHFWLKMREMGDQTPLDDYCLGTTLAMHDKFTTPSPNPPSSLSVFDWALHFDATLFGHLMRDFAIDKGVRRVDAKVSNVNLNPDNGFIDSVTLEGHDAPLAGDLFIDCSGFKALLIEGALKTGYEDWSQWLPTDSAVAVQSESVGEPHPYTVSTAHEAGWQWNIPLQHRQGNGHVYCSEYISDDEATEVLMRNIDGPLSSDPKMFRFVPGRRKKAWNKNCISVGLASGFLEPLESTAIALVETAIEKIRLLFPDKSMPQGCIDEFNDMTRLEYERVRDFIILHYHATARTDAPLWNHCRTMEIPEPLAHKMKLFKQRGHLVKYRWEIFQPASWLALYSGNNIYPEMYDPRVDTFDMNYVRKSLAEMKKSLQSAMEPLPSHGEFIRKNCYYR